MMRLWAWISLVAVVAVAALHLATRDGSAGRADASSVAARDVATRFATTSIRGDWREAKRLIAPDANYPGDAFLQKQAEFFLQRHFTINRPARFAKGRYVFLLRGRSGELSGAYVAETAELTVELARPAGRWGVSQWQFEPLEVEVSAP
jgi:hypothetical protein